MHSKCATLITIVVQIIGFQIRTIYINTNAKNAIIVEVSVITTIQNVHRTQKPASNDGDSCCVISHIGNRLQIAYSHIIRWSTLTKHALYSTQGYITPSQNYIPPTPQYSIPISDPYGIGPVQSVGPPLPTGGNPLSALTDLLSGLIVHKHLLDVAASLQLLR